jgi:hypothetical protein
MLRCSFRQIVLDRVVKYTPYFETVTVRLGNFALLVLQRVGLVYRAKPNVQNAGRQKIIF